MNRAIVLDGSRVTNRADMCKYMRSQFGEDFACENLDALHDALSEVTEDILFVLTRRNVTLLCQDPYAYKVLLVIGSAAQENPHLQIQFAR